MMMTIRTVILTILVAIAASCNNTAGKRDPLQESNCYYPVENFVDSTQIGEKGRHKIEISLYADSSFTDSFTVIFFYEKENSGGKTFWRCKQKFIFDSINILAYENRALLPRVSDFNGDIYNDFIYRSGISANGRNDIFRLFIYSPENDSLVYIKNSEKYPHLKYSMELNSITANWIASTKTAYLLKIENDSLKEFVHVCAMNDSIYVYEIDKNSNAIPAGKIKNTVNDTDSIILADSSLLNIASETILKYK
jgi:hypothetical protein